MLSSWKFSTTGAQDIGAKRLCAVQLRAMTSDASALVGWGWGWARAPVVKESKTKIAEERENASEVMISQREDRERDFERQHCRVDVCFFSKNCGRLL